MTDARTQAASPDAAIGPPDRRTPPRGEVDPSDRLRLILEALDGFAYEWDVASDVAVRSAGLLDLLGYPPTEVTSTGAWWRTLIHPDDLPRVVAQDREAFSDRTVGRYASEYRVRHRDGSWRWLRNHTRIVRGSNGAVHRVFGLTLDVTRERTLAVDIEVAARARDEERRRRQESQAILARASAVLAESLDPRETADAIARAALPDFADWAIVDGIDEHGRFERMALAHVDPVMVSRAEELDRRWRPDYELDAGSPWIARTGQPLLMSDVTIEQFAPLARDAEHLAAWSAFRVRSYLGVPIRAGQRVLGVLNLFTAESGRRFEDADIPLALELGQRAGTALERAHLYAAERVARADAEQARIAAEQANRAKSEFLATMSHELRTPLNAIGGYVELIQLGIRGPVTQAQHADLERVQHNQRHLLTLINEILSYARVERGMMTYDLQPVPLVELAQAALLLVEMQAAARALALELRGASTAEGAVALADRDRTHQVLLNLLSNAIKFTPTGGNVVVEVDGTPDARGMLAVHVHDTGIGIPGDKLDVIFEPFVQVGRALNSPSEGTGLGLAISRDLARGMGGDLTVSSATGEGTTFTLCLPAVVAGRADVSWPPAPPVA